MFVVLIEHLVRFLVFGYVLQIGALEIIRTNGEKFHYSFLWPRDLRPLAGDNLYEPSRNVPTGLRSGFVPVGAGEADVWGGDACVALAGGERHSRD